METKDRNYFDYLFDQSDGVLIFKWNDNEQRSLATNCSCIQPLEESVIVTSVEMNLNSLYRKVFKNLKKWGLLLLTNSYIYPEENTVSNSEYPKKYIQEVFCQDPLRSNWLKDE